MYPSWKDRVNWWQLILTVAPLALTGVFGLIGLYYTIENRVLIQEKQMENVIQEVADHRTRIGKLEETSNRNDEKLNQVLERTKETRDELTEIRRDLSAIAINVRAVRQKQGQ